MTIESATQLLVDSARDAGRMNALCDVYKALRGHEAAQHIVLALITQEARK